MTIKDLLEVLKGLDQDQPITIYDALSGDAYRNIDTWQLDGETGLSLVINQDAADLD
tara:strand:- start:386 stop:556 length:171 start_codon:yes stop_codon:yes gene_type:complete